MWTSLKGPRFPVGPQRITTHAFGRHPDDYSIYVTNGAVIMGSSAFCRWTELYRLPAAPDSAEPYSSSDSVITVLDASMRPNTVYAGIQSNDATRGVHVVRTTDAFGGEWAPASGGALQAATGRLRALRSAPSNPDVVYALVDPTSEAAPLELPVGATQVVYRTADGGGRWEARSVLARRPGGLPDELALPSLVVNDDLKGIAVDPANDGNVWLFGAGGLLQSRDGATTFALQVADAIGVVDIAMVPGVGSRVRAYELAAASRMHVSDGGAPFVPAPGPPGVAQSASSGTGFIQHVVSSNAGVYGLPAPALPGMPYTNFSPPDRRAVFDIVTAALPGNPIGALLVGRTDATIEIFLLVQSITAPPKPPPLVLDDSDVATFDAGDIAPDGRRIVLRPGESRRVHYRLILPPAPTPLDVYFLIDVSGSMDDAIRGVQVAMNAIVSRLHAQGIDVHFGVGQYRAYTDGPAYERVRNIGPVNSSLRYALQHLYAQGGGEETQLAALYQSVTGFGQDEEYISSDSRRLGRQNAFIKKNQQFDFRTGSARVAIHVSDEVFSTGGPHPTYEEVGAALVNARVKQVGIAITPESQQAVSGNPRPGLEKVAGLSDARAPEPVDCDGDGTDDIAADEPLVCEMDRGDADQAVRMSTVVLGLLDAIEDIQDVGIRTSRAAPAGAARRSPVVERVDPSLLGGVDLKSDNRLGFDVLYRCPLVKETRRFVVELRAATASRPLARADTTVVCRVEVEDEKDPPAIAAVVPVVPVVPPPVRPPDPAPNPNPRPQPNPNLQGSPQAQAGLASQQQERPQLAFAVQNPVPEAEPAAAKAGDQYRMSNYYSRRREPTTPFAAFAVGAAAMSMAFGYAALARRQVRTQHARAVARPYR